MTTAMALISQTQHEEEGLGWRWVAPADPSADLGWLEINSYQIMLPVCELSLTLRRA